MTGSTTQQGGRRSYIWLVFAAVIVGLVIVEVFSRIFLPSPGQMLDYQPSAYARSVFAQEAREIDDITTGITYPINRWGYRGPEFDLKKRPGVVRIIFIGGSSVFDLGNGGNDDWPHQTGDLLTARGYNVEVINAGIPGHATSDAVGRVYSELWMLEPDMVVLSDCWNDLKYFNNLSPEHPLIREVSPLAQSAFECSGAECLLGWSRAYFLTKVGVLSMQGKLGPEGVIESGPVIETMNSYGIEQYKLNLALFVEAVREIGAEPVLVHEPRLAIADASEADRERIEYGYVHMTHEALVDGFAACDSAINGEGEESDVWVADPSSEISGESGLFNDHVHLSAEGSKRMAEYMAEFLVDVLDRRED